MEDERNKMTAPAARTVRRSNPAAGPILDRSGQLSNQVDICLLTVLFFSASLATISSRRVGREWLKTGPVDQRVNQPFQEST